MADHGAFDLKNDIVTYLKESIMDFYHFINAKFPINADKENAETTE